MLARSLHKQRAAHLNPSLIKLGSESVKTEKTSLSRIPWTDDAVAGKVYAFRLRLFYRKMNIIENSRGSGRLVAETTTTTR